MVKLYVEGGGDGKALQIECRQGFSEFLKKAGLTGKLPRISACGGRRSAYEDYCTAVKNGEAAVLLVDSEAPVISAHQSAGDSKDWLPWAHLKSRPGDGWESAKGGADTDCHLMIEVMENWFMADREVLKDFFNPGFRENQLPAKTRPIESLSKNTVYDALQRATANCKTKAPYGKGDHSFKILAKLDPQKVIAASPWAKRFVDQLKLKMGA